MASEATAPRKFEVLRSAKRLSPKPEDFIESEHQANLFASPKRGLIIFMYFPDVTEEEFRATVEYAKPANILELRSAPRFDIGTLNRRLAFDVFEHQNSTYIDLGCPGKESRNFDYLLWECKSVLKDSKVRLGRPMMFLMSKDDADAGLPAAIRQLVSSVLPEYNEVFEVPHFSRR
jgi:hypothetical protein